LPLQLVVPATDNPRGADPGDVDDLVASIQAVGVLQPVTVTPRGRLYVLVFGHRRRAASIKAGKATIPAIVLETTEVERILAQNVENLHRADLNPIQEAQAIANLRDAVAAERGGQGPGQRELAAMLGISQSHVSKRLKLLQLPKDARDLVAAGKLTLDQATKLYELVEVGRAKQAASFAKQEAAGTLKDYGGRSTLVDRVDAEVKEAKARAHEDQVRKELTAAGATVLTTPQGGWYRARVAVLVHGQAHDDAHCRWLLHNELAEITVDEHAAAHPDGHVAALCRTHGEPLWVCTDPTVHAETEHKAAEQAARQAELDAGEAARKERDRLLGRAAKAREAFLVELLRRPVRVHATDRTLVSSLVRVAAERLESEAAKLACRLLGVDPMVEEPRWKGDTRHKNYREAIRRYAADPANLSRAARAVPWAEAEFRARWSYGEWGRLVVDYVDELVAAGYALSSAEQERYDEGQRAAAQAAKQATAAAEP
jgi:ParB/RepB/Spo0J family partition protein